MPQTVISVGDNTYACSKTRDLDYIQSDVMSLGESDIAQIIHPFC